MARGVRRREKPVLVPVITHEERSRCWEAIKAQHPGLPSEAYAERIIIKARDAWWFVVYLTEWAQKEGFTGPAHIGVPCNVQVVWSTDRRLRKKFIQVNYRRGAWTTKATCHYCGGDTLEGEHTSECDRPRRFRPARRLARSRPSFGYFAIAAHLKSKGKLKMEEAVREHHRRMAYHFGL